MGINCLLPFVKKYSTNVNINRFSGQTIAVDASCWIHKSLAISVSQTGTRERFSRIFNSHIQLLKDAGVIPLMVFDGLPLPAKEKENARRQSERRERMEKAQTISSTTQRNKLASQGQEKTYHDVVECIKLCLCQRVKYVVSPYESDAQIAFLLKNGYADVAVTEDSDLLVYGCEKVIFKLGMTGHGEYFELNNILSGLNTTKTEFVHGCIAAGCDYLSNVRGVGIHRAFSFVKSGKLFEELKKKHSPANYDDLFQMALAVFQHQSVFNPTLLTVQPLNPWTEDPGDEVKHFCGLVLDKEFAKEMAAGNICMKSRNKENDFPYLQSIPAPDTSAPEVSAPEVPKKGISALTIVDVDTSWFTWTIPCFPVMSVDFVRAKASINDTHMDCLIKKDANIHLGELCCTSYCTISIEKKEYTVLWEFTQPEVGRAQVLHNSINIESDDESNMNVQHSLPFKVLGTCKSVGRQSILEEACSYLNEYNRPVFVQLEREPDNAHDSNAIAVFVMTDNDFYKVGYIASELTQYVHPCLDDPSFEVSVKNIRFSTTWMMVGYYITIELSKKGLWHKNVVKASKNVK